MRRASSASAALLLTAVGTADLAGQSWRNVTMSRQVDDEEEVFVEVDYDVGRFTIRPGDPGSLYRMQLRYDEELFEPVSDYRGNRLRLGVDGVDRGLNIGSGDRAGALELELARNLPLSLDLDFGAVRADLDLGGLALRGLSVSTGASDSRLGVSEPNRLEMEEATFEVGAASFTATDLGNLNASRIEVDAGVGDLTLDFTGEWRRDAYAVVNLGLGSLELRFPRDIGVRLIRDTFLTSLDAPEFERRGDEYFSAGWESADVRVTVEIDATFGKIDVDWVR